MTIVAVRWLSRRKAGVYQRMTGRCLAASAPSTASSVKRLAIATMSAPRLHTSRNQPDGGTWVAAAPPSARSPKTEATKISSTTGTCLSSRMVLRQVVHVRHPVGVDVQLHAGDAAGPL